MLVLYEAADTGRSSRELPSYWPCKHDRLAKANAKVGVRSWSEGAESARDPKSPCWIRWSRSGNESPGNCRLKPRNACGSESAGAERGAEVGKAAGPVIRNVLGRVWPYPTGPGRLRESAAS